MTFPTHAIHSNDSLDNINPSKSIKTDDSSFSAIISFQMEKCTA